MVFFRVRGREKGTSVTEPAPNCPRRTPATLSLCPPCNERASRQASYTAARWWWWCRQASQELRRKALRSLRKPFSASPRAVQSPSSPPAADREGFVDLRTATTTTDGKVAETEGVVRCSVLTADYGPPCDTGMAEPRSRGAFETAVRRVLIEG